MSNDCYNNITITCEDWEELDKLFNNVIYYKKNITIENKCWKGIKFQQITVLKPDFEWLKSLLPKYPNCWVKNEWYEEGGTAGVWVGSVKNGIQNICWEDLCIDAKDDIFLDNSHRPKKY